MLMCDCRVLPLDLLKNTGILHMGEVDLDSHHSSSKDNRYLEGRNLNFPQLQLGISIDLPELGFR